MAKNVLSEATRVNKTACQAHTAETIILIIAYLIEVLKGEKTIGYYAAFVVIGAIPVIIEWLLYKKNTESSAIKHVICIGFAIFYAFVIFTTPNFLSFVYALPIIVALSVYNDKKYILMANVGVVIMVVLVCCGVGSADFSMFTTPMEYKEIMIAVMLVMSSFSVLVSNTTYNVNKDKVEVLNEAKAETEEVLAKVEQNSESLQKGIQNIHVLVSELLDSTASTKAAMEEVGSGSTETAEAVQMQLSQTVVVGEQVDNVEEITKLILDKMNESVDAVKSGNDNLAELIKEVNSSVSNGEEVAGKLSELNGRIDEMNSIISMINSISSQTSLLALNASIEAARAGEAGRGFAVVAGEISNLSTQTQDATSKITSLINNVAGAIAEVITVINTMIEGINSEKESTASAEESFKTIGEDINAIMTSVEELNTGVASLKAANNEISDSVQTISAISEEVSAHASETIGSEEANVVRLNSIMEKANELLEAAAN